MKKIAMSKEIMDVMFGENATFPVHGPETINAEYMGMKLCIPNYTCDNAWFEVQDDAPEGKSVDELIDEGYEVKFYMDVSGTIICDLKDAIENYVDEEEPTEKEEG